MTSGRPSMTPTGRPSPAGVYLVTSGTGQRTVDAAVAATRAGIRWVQVRAKDLAGTGLLELVGEVSHGIRDVAPETRVLVDDDVAVAVEARRRGWPVHGVHLGQDDMPVREARTLLGAEAVIGLTTGTLTLVEAAAAVADVVDYLGAGPFRITPTKDSGRPPLGLAGYPPLVAATGLPVVAIGDIGPGDVAPLAATGVAGVAVVRAVMAAEDPGEMAAQLVREWQTARG